MKNLIKYQALKVCALSIVLILVSKGNLFGQINTWIGGNGDWDVSSNWSLGVLPNNNHSVYINQNDEVRIPAGINSNIQFLNLQGKLKVEGTINITNTSGTAILLIGELENEGIVSLNGNGSGDYPIYSSSSGKVINQVNAEIYCDSGHGIFITDSTSFYNYGKIAYTTFCSGNAIYVDQKAKFYNYGTIESYDSIHMGGIEVDSAGLFENGLGGNLLLYKINGWMIHMKDSASVLINKGNISTGNNFRDSEINITKGKFYNNISGVIEINGPHTGGIRTYNDSEFHNEGELQLSKGTNELGLFIDENSSFFNKKPGLVNVLGKISIGYSSTLDNQSFIFQNYAGLNIDALNSVYNNSGIIVDCQGSFKFIGGTNNGYYLTKITSQVYQGVPVSPTIQGPGVGWNVLFNTVYLEESLNNSAGSIINNSWTPSAAAIGKDTFYIAVDDGANLAGVIKFTTSSPVQVSCLDLTFLPSSGDWDNPSNWNKGRLPTACDTVNIPSSSSVSILPGIMAVSAKVNNLGTLSISSTASLTISGSNNNGLYNEGTLLNDGDIVVNNVSESGILNSSSVASFVNTGSITMTNGIGSHGIINLLSSNFQNQSPGTISISSTTQDAILNNGASITNEGNILVKSNIGRYGIFNGGVGAFNNLGGSITIESSTLRGVINTSAGTTFNNSGLIHFKSGTGGDGIINTVSSTFNNQFNGEIVIADVTENGILNTQSATFNNQAGAEVSIQNTQKNGVKNSASFNNLGKIVMTFGVDSLAILNESPGLFDNQICGKINIEKGILNKSSMVNQGYLRQDYIGFNSNTGTIQNGGVITDVQHSFNGVTIINNGRHIAPLVGTFTEGVPIPNVLKGTGTGITISNNQFYTTELATQSAGNYDNITNVWIPNNLAVGSTKFFMIADDGNSCPDTVEINLSTPVQPACLGGPNNWNGGATGNWDVSTNWDQGHVPKSCEDVFIPAGVTVTIQGGTFAEARSIHTNGYLINQQQLIISGASDKPGIHNLGGIVENNGTLLISTVKGINGENHGIKNEGVGATFVNTNTLTIDDVDDYGILNKSDATINFGGITNINNTGVGAIKNELGGNINGSGDFNLSSGIFTNEGNMRPGNSIGANVIIGNYNSTITANYDVEIDGYGGAGLVGGHDFIEVQGDLGLHGTMNVVLGPGFAPEESDVFPIMSYTGTLTGSFAAENLPSPEMDGWQVDYGVLIPGKITIYKPPVHDECSNAISIVQTNTGSTTESWHTFAATTTGAPPTCDTDMNTAPGVWYKLTVSNFLDYTITLCNSDFDTKIGLFLGSCGSLGCIKGNDDDNALNGLGVCSVNTTSSIALSSTEIENFFPGQVTSDVYIYVTGYATETGLYEMEITASLPPCTPNVNMWVGGGTNTWNDASQWSLNHIPRYCEHIEMASGLVLIPSGYMAQGQSIHLSGQLINNGGNLVLSGAHNQPGIDVDGGMIENNGLISVFNITGTQGVGMEANNSSSIINNGTISTLLIEGTEMIIHLGCNFINNGTIDIQD